MLRQWGDWSTIAPHSRISSTIVYAAAGSVPTPRQKPTIGSQLQQGIQCLSSSNCDVLDALTGLTNLVQESAPGARALYPDGMDDNGIGVGEALAAARAASIGDPMSHVPVVRLAEDNGVGEVFWDSNGFDDSIPWTSNSFSES